MKPRIFVGSSVEALPISYAIQKNLFHQAEVTVWDQGIFQLSQYSLQALISALGTFDFGIFVFSSDDVLTIRGETCSVARDNVVFELGLFIGQLGQARCFILIPDGSGGLHLPTDLLGFTPAAYEQDRSDHNWLAATGPACSDIRSQLQILGRRSIGEEHAEGTAPVTEPQEISPKRTDVRPSEESEPAKEKSDQWFDYWSKDLLDDALESIEAAISNELEAEGRFNLRLWRALICLEQAIEKGENEFRSLAKEFPENPEPWIQFAYALLHKGFREKALTLVEEGLSCLPGNHSLLGVKAHCLDTLQRLDEAEILLKESIESPSLASDTLVAQLVRLQIAHGKNAEALDSIAYGLKQFSFSTELLELKASILLSSDDYSGAASVYRQLINLKSNEPSYYALMGNALLALDFYSLALDAYRRADALANGSLGWIIANIGNAFNNKGFFGFAIEYLEKALTENPSSDYAQDRILSARRNQAAELQRLEIAINQAILRTSPPKN